MASVKQWSCYPVSTVAKYHRESFYDNFLVGLKYNLRDHNTDKLCHRKIASGLLAYSELLKRYIMHSYRYAWASYQVRKIAGCAFAGIAGNDFPRHRRQGKQPVSDPGMHHGTCVNHVPWCMSGSLTSGGGENVPGIPGACATRNFTYLVRGPLAV